MAGCTDGWARGKISAGRRGEGVRREDVRFVGSMHSQGRASEYPASEGELTREQQAAYKIILAIDGNAWASCWEWALASGSVIVYLGVWSLHLMADLQPWVHYVPCPSVHELEQSVAWVLSHPTEAEAIAQAAHTLFQRVATRQHSIKCIRETLLALVEIDSREA